MSEGIGRGFRNNPSRTSFIANQLEKNIQLGIDEVVQAALSEGEPINTIRRDSGDARVFTLDADIEAAVDSAAEIARETCVPTPEKTRVALFNGSFAGRIISMAPEFNSSIIVAVDPEKTANSFLRLSEKLVKECTARSDFLGQRNAIFRETGISLEEMDEAQAAEIDHLGEFHFLGSDERYTICRNALRKQALRTGWGSMRQPGVIASVGHALRAVKSELVFAYMDTIGDSMGPALTRTIDQILPFAEGCPVIGYSNMQVNDELGFERQPDPVPFVSQGGKAYGADAAGRGFMVQLDWR